jgi:hypothetical protein
MYIYIINFIKVKSSNIAVNFRMIDVETYVVSYQKTTIKTNVVIDIKFNVSLSTFGNKKRLTTTKPLLRQTLNVKTQKNENNRWGCTLFCRS